MGNRSFQEMQYVAKLRMLEQQLEIAKKATTLVVIGAQQDEERARQMQAILMATVQAAGGTLRIDREAMSIEANTRPPTEAELAAAPAASGETH